MRNRRQGDSPYLICHHLHHLQFVHMPPPRAVRRQHEYHESIRLMAALRPLPCVEIGEVEERYSHSNHISSHVFGGSGTGEGYGAVGRDDDGPVGTEHLFDGGVVDGDSDGEGAGLT